MVVQNIQDLPLEVLTIIITLAEEADPIHAPNASPEFSTLPSCILVSRTFFQIAAPLLYRDIRISVQHPHDIIPMIVALLSSDQRARLRNIQPDLLSHDDERMVHPSCVRKIICDISPVYLNAYRRIQFWRIMDELLLDVPNLQSLQWHCGLSSQRFESQVERCAHLQSFGFEMVAREDSEGALPLMTGLGMPLSHLRRLTVDYGLGLKEETVGIISLAKTLQMCCKTLIEVNLYRLPDADGYGHEHRANSAPDALKGVELPNVKLLRVIDPNHETMTAVIKMVDLKRLQQFQYVGPMTSQEVGTLFTEKLLRMQRVSLNCEPESMVHIMDLCTGLTAIHLVRRGLESGDSNEKVLAAVIQHGGTLREFTFTTGVVDDEAYYDTFRALECAQVELLVNKCQLLESVAVDCYDSNAIQCIERIVRLPHLTSLFLKVFNGDALSSGSYFHREFRMPIIMKYVVQAYTAYITQRSSPTARVFNLQYLKVELVGMMRNRHPPRKQHYLIHQLPDACYPLTLYEGLDEDGWAEAQIERDDIFDGSCYTSPSGMELLVERVEEVVGHGRSDGVYGMPHKFRGAWDEAFKSSEGGSSSVLIKNGCRDDLA